MARSAVSPSAEAKTGAAVPHTAGGLGSAVPLPRQRRLVLVVVALVALVIAAVVLVVSLSAAGGAPQGAQPGLPDAGPITGWGLPFARLIVNLSAVATIGSLVIALLIPGRADRIPDAASRLLRATTWSALVWAVAGAGLAVLTVSEVAGVPLRETVHPATLNRFVWDLPQASRQLVGAGVAAALAAYSRLTSRRAGVAVLLVVAVGALLPALLSGHSSAGTDHDLATSSLVVHVVAASLWVGGLGAMLVSLRGSPQLLADVLPRFSALALCCFTAVASSGLLNVWIRSSGDPLSWVDSGYGALVVTKTAALLALGVMGWWHRSRTVAALRDGVPRAFARLAAVELVVMTATIAVAVALSRTPTPEAAPLSAKASPGAGYSTLAANVDPFEPGRLVTEWRPDAVWLTVVGLWLAAYALGWRRLRRRSVDWPTQLVVAASGAAVVTLLATSGGLGSYSTASLSLQVCQFLALFVVAPVLVSLSAPLTLAVESRRGVDHKPRAGDRHPQDREPTRAEALLTAPATGVLLTGLLLAGLYATPLLDASLRSGAWHLAVNAVTLCVGLLLWSSVLAVDAALLARPRAYRAAVLMGCLAMLVAVGTRIYLSDSLLAGGWFSALDWQWLDPRTDQRRAAAVMWAAVIVLGPLIWVLFQRPLPEPPSDRTRSDTAPRRGRRWAA